MIDAFNFTIVLLILIQPPLIIIAFFYSIINNKNLTNNATYKITGAWTIIIQPIIFILFSSATSNELLGDHSILLGMHSPIIYVSIFLYSLAFIISLINIQDEEKPYYIELLTDIFLFLGILINMILIFDLYNTLESFEANIYTVMGHLPIILLLSLKLHSRQNKLIERCDLTIKYGTKNTNYYALKILESNPFYRGIFYTTLLIFLLIIPTTLYYYFLNYN